MSLILPPIKKSEMPIPHRKFLYYKLNNIINPNIINDNRIHNYIFIIHNTETDTMTPIYGSIGMNSKPPNYGSIKLNTLEYEFTENPINLPTSDNDFVWAVNKKLKSHLANAAKTINDTIFINTRDEDVKISITSTATIFSINIIIDNNFISIYKKIYHDKLDPVTSISTNYIKHKSRIKESICKMAEFIYENKNFINNLIKIKKILVTQNFKAKDILINNDKIYINVGELSKLKYFKQLSEQDCLNFTDLYNIKLAKHEFTHNFNISKFLSSRLTNILYSTKDNSNVPIESIINKQNFDLINKTKVKIDLTHEKYVTNIPNGFLISKDYYNKLYNNNKKLNYYYGKKFTSGKFTIFDNNPAPDIHGKIKYHEETFNKITDHKLKFLIFVKSYSNDIKILNKKIISNEIDQEKQLIELETNYNHIKKLENEFNQLMIKFNERIPFVLLIQYLFNRNRFQITEDMVKYSRSNSAIFINNRIISKLSKAIENIKYNIEVNKLENYKIIKSINDSIINNDLLFVMFNQNIIMKQGNIFPARFTKILKNLISHNYYDRSRFLTEIVNPKKTIALLKISEYKVFETKYDYKLHDLLILMSSKFSEQEVEDIKNRWVLITLNHL